MLNVALELLKFITIQRNAGNFEIIVIVLVDLSFNRTYYGENGESRPTIGVTLGYTQYSHFGASFTLCVTYSLG